MRTKSEAFAIRLFQSLSERARKPFRARSESTSLAFRKASEQSPFTVPSERG